VQSKAKEKHNIKRADRLLSNQSLLSERHRIYEAIIRRFIQPNTRPIILVDWSDMDEYRRHFLLRAALVFDGRALTLYEEVHALGTKEKRATHKRFLQQLQRLLPTECRPIIVTDAGFKVPWFQLVLSMGWDFIGRSRKPNYYSLDGLQWRHITELYRQATATPKSMEAYIRQTDPYPCRLVVYRQKPKGRHNLNRFGVPKQSKASKVHAQGANEPWVISTSLPLSHQLARKVVKIYRTRMQIEEAFRDLKSVRFGQGFEQNKSYLKQRITLLILLTTIAHWVLLLLGCAVTCADKHRQYQANTTRSKRVLSFHFIGLRAVLDKKLKLLHRHWQHAISLLAEYSQESFYAL
jgi:hypothetical protein